MHHSFLTSHLLKKRFGSHALLRIFSLLALSLCLMHCTKHEPFWSESERALLRSLSIASLSPPATDFSNRVARNESAAALGKALFFDTRLSKNNALSCASCHQPRLQFSDGLTVGRGINQLSRNTPSIIGGAWQSWFYWDGRRDSLWSQALIPIEAPDEMGGSRVGAVRLITTDRNYLAQYTEVFGPVSKILTPGKLPTHAGEFADTEGQDAWYRLPRATQKAVNETYANIGKAIAAFERTLTPKDNAFDHYVKTLETQGEEAAAHTLDAAAIRGAKLFIDVEKTRCLQCHNGPLLTNGDFHNVGSAPINNNSATGQTLDFGRLFGVQSVLLDQFNCLGPYSDAEQKQCSSLRFLSREQHVDSAGAFKTPSLRNVAQTAPYFHNGQFATLEDVLNHYNTATPNNASELVPLKLTKEQINDLAAFLTTLNSPVYAEFERREPLK